MHNFKSTLFGTRKFIFGQKKYSSHNSLFTSLAGYYHGKDANSMFKLLPGMLYARDLNDGTFRIASVSWNRKIVSFDVGTIYLRECFTEEVSTVILDNNIIETKITVQLENDDSSNGVCEFKFHNEKLIQYKMENYDFDIHGRSRLICSHKLIDLVKVDLDVSDDIKLNNDKKFYQVLGLC
jgi:hypothetical protein